MSKLRFLAWLSCWCLMASAGHAAKTEARLVLAANTARPGETILAAVQLKMQPRWHTYWRYAGDSGAPTTIKWTLPAGVSAGEILWPVPEKDVTAGLTTYIYLNEAALLVPITLAENMPAGEIELKAAVSWLECEQVCVPGKAEVKATLTVGPASKASADAGLIEAALKKLPLKGLELAARAWWDGPAKDDSRAVAIEWTPKDAAAGADFFPIADTSFEIAGETKALAGAPGKMRLSKVIKKLEGGWPSQLAGLIVEKSGPDTAKAYEVQMAIASSGTGAAISSTPRETSSMSLPVLLGKLGLAFLGGLILNIMPCVLPVIALKILGFVQQSQQSPGRVRKLGLIYALGVLWSFLILAGLVIGVQQAGRAASWGMQFQNPQFVIVMTTLVTLVALNLFGIFEVTLGGAAMGAAGNLAAKEGSSGAFFNGVLATALATPCTAPYLAVALGWALAQPPKIIVLMFLVMGLGLAAPYVVLSWFLQFLKVLPKPGAWMEKFKIAMGFPMLATALWLLTLTTRHFGNTGPLWVGLFLVAVAFAGWVWGEFVQRGTKRKGLAIVISLAVLAAGYSWGLESELHWRSPAKLASGNGTIINKPGDIEWQPWSAAGVENARAEGRPVLVDFTADWCVTCQANKLTSLEIPSVRAKLKEINAAAFLGDYTLEDAAITAELRRFDRAGVPLVLVYPKDAKQPPMVLPAILTPGIVLEALERAAR